LGQRQTANQATRTRIVAAARDLLASSGGLGDFTMESVARQAGVARMTVYYQFGSRAGLLEAIFDDLAASGGMQELQNAFEQPDALAALDEFISVFTRFWVSARLVIRRLQVLTAVDPELEKVSREDWRRQGLQVILRRSSEQIGHPAAGSLEEAVDLLHVLTSFQTFDRLADSKRSPEEVTDLIRRLARAVIELPA
jgi:AcrR family transcriptional regulator